MRILASNPDTIGDMILRQPLYRAVLDAGHELALIVRGSVAPVVPYVAPGAARVIVLPAEPYRDDVARHWDEFGELFAAARDWRPDVLLVAPYQWTQVEERLAEELRQGVPEVRVVGMSGKLYAGDPWAGHAAPSRLRLDTMAEVAADAAEAEKNAVLASVLLGRAPPDPDPRIDAGPEALDAARGILAGLGFEPGGYTVACVTGTVNVPIKAWPADRWARVLAEWSRRYGRRFLFVGLPAERAVAEEVRAAMGDRAAWTALWMDEAGTFDHLVGLTALSGAYVGHDTGPMHVAAALGKPVVAVFGGGTWPRFLPRVTPSVALTVGVPCVGCGWTCTFDTSHCVKAVSEDEVLRAIDDLEAGRVGGREARVLEPPRELLNTMIGEVSRYSRSRLRDIGDLTARSHAAEHHAAERGEEARQARAGAERAAAEAAALAVQLRDRKSAAERLREEMQRLARELQAARSEAQDLRREVARLKARSRRQRDLEASRPPRRPLRQVMVDLITGSRDYAPRRDPPLPRLTLVTPVHAFDARAAATIGSALAVDDPQLEYVVVDATPDDAPHMPEALRERVEAVGRVLRVPGPAAFAGVKEAFETSSAEVVGWLPVGSVLEPSGPRQVAEAFRDHPRAPVFYFENAREVNGWRLPPAPRPRAEVYSLLACDAPPPISVFFRRHEYMLLTRLDPSAGAAAGWELTLRFARRYGLRRGPGTVACTSSTGHLAADVAADFARAREQFLAGFGKAGRLRCRIIRHAADWGHRLGGGERVSFAPDENALPAVSPPAAPAPINPVTGRRPDRLLFTGRDARVPVSADDHAWPVYYDIAGDAAVVSVAGDFAASAARCGEPPGILAERALSLLRDLVAVSDPHVRVLAVDCGDGGMLDLLKARTAWQLAGTASGACADAARAKGHETWQTTAADAFMTVPDGRTFDVIVLPGIERSPEPVELLRRLRLMLSPGGLLAVATPNLDSRLLSRFGPAWSHWRLPEHRILFGRRGLRMLAGQADFRVVRLRTQTDPSAVARSMQLEAAGVAGSVPEDTPPSPEMMQHAQGLRAGAAVVGPAGPRRRHVGRALVKVEAAPAAISIMPLPRITVVTPSYNQAPYIGWTARSVLLQRYPNLEYIIMDGGSTDGTMDVLAPYAERLAYLVSERDKGQSDAVHKGFARSTGDIMAYLNSDDMLAPGTLHHVAQFFRDHPDVDVVYSHRCTVDAHNRVRWYWMLPGHSDWYMSRWDLIPQETCFWRRRMFDKCGNVDPAFRFALDYDLFVRFMQAGGRFVRLDRVMGVFREHDAAKTSQWMQTVGAQEIEKVRARYGIKKGRLDLMVSARFYFGAIRRGQQFAASRRKLPGAMPGVGYDYNDVWAGLLDDGRLPPLAESPARAAVPA